MGPVITAFLVLLLLAVGIAALSLELFENITTLIGG